MTVRNTVETGVVPQPHSLLHWRLLCVSSNWIYEEDTMINCPFEIFPSKFHPHALCLLFFLLSFSFFFPVSLVQMHTHTHSDFTETHACLDIHHHKQPDFLKGLKNFRQSTVQCTPLGSKMSLNYSVIRHIFSSFPFVITRWFMKSESVQEKFCRDKRWVCCLL